MAEKEPEQKSDGKGLFIIRNGRKVAKYEDANGCRYFVESSFATHPTELRLKCRTKMAITSRVQIEGCRAKAMMRGLPWPLHRGHCTSRSATRIDASGSRGFTRKSRSTTVPQLSQAIINQ